MIEERIKTLVENELKSIDLTVPKVEYVKEGTNNFLRIYIDKEGIVDLNTCVKATHIINKAIDNIDILDDAYILDVTTIEKGRNHE